MPFFQSRALHNKFVKTTVIDAAYYFVIYLYISFLSPYLSTLGWSEVAKGWFFAMFSAIGIIASPLAGTISDKIGRFKLIIFGISLEIVALAGYILCSSPLALYIVRALSAIAFSVIVVTSLARLNDTVTDNSTRTKITGIAQSIISVTVIIAPLVGGYIADAYGYQEVFLVSWILMTIILVGLMIYDLCFYKDSGEHRIREKLRRKDFNPLTDIREAMQIKKIRAMSILGFAANFSIPVTMSVLPFLVIMQMQLTNLHLSILIFVMGVAHTFQYLFGKIADKKGKGKATLAGIYINGIMLLLLFFAKNYYVLIIFVLIKALGGALFNVSTWSYLSDIAEKRNIEGKVVGSYAAISRLAVTISFIITGFLLPIMGYSIFVLYGIIMLAAALATRKTIIATQE